MVDDDGNKVVESGWTDRIEQNTLKLHANFVLLIKLIYC